MLSVEEVLLLKAAQNEVEKQESMQNAALAGTIGGAAIGTVGGQLPHMIGRGINKMTGRQPNRLKPGPRMAGGLTGLILGGGLGAGVAALMKQNNPEADLLAKIQTQGGSMSVADKFQLERALADAYSKPSQLG